MRGKTEKVVRERPVFPDKNRPQRKNGPTSPLRSVIPRLDAIVTSPHGRRRRQWTCPVGPRRSPTDAQVTPTLLRTAFRATDTSTGRSSPVRLDHTTGRTTHIRPRPPLNVSPPELAFPLHLLPSRDFVPSTPSLHTPSLILFLFPISFPSALLPSQWLLVQHLVPLSVFSLLCPDPSLSRYPSAITAPRRCLPWFLPPIRESDLPQGVSWEWRRGMAAPAAGHPRSLRACSGWTSKQKMPPCSIGVNPAFMNASTL
jgi:hypothetical protein